MANSYLSIGSDGELYTDLGRLITDINTRFGESTIVRASELEECNKCTPVK